MNNSRQSGTLSVCLDTGLLGGRGCLTGRLRLGVTSTACTAKPPDCLPGWRGRLAGSRKWTALGKTLLLQSSLETKDLKFLEKIRKILASFFLHSFRIKNTPLKSSCEKLIDHFTHENTSHRTPTKSKQKLATKFSWTGSVPSREPYMSKHNVDSDIVLLFTQKYD